MEIGWTDRVRYEGMLLRVKEQGNILYTTERRKVTGLPTSCFLKQDTEENIEGMREGTGRRRKRRKQLLEDLKESRRYWKWEIEAPDRTVWTNTGNGK